jgi:hypothetical protein
VKVHRKLAKNFRTKTKSNTERTERKNGRRKYITSQRRERE